MNRRKIYITPEQYQFYLQTGFPYEGYVIGLGYAYIEYQQIPYRRVLNKEQVNQLSQIGFSKICKLQRLDTSDKAILESYGENLLDQVIEERNGKLYVNMGDGTIVETSKNSEIQLNILNNNEYSVTVKEANSPNYKQVIGNTSDFIEQTALGERRKDLLKKLSLTVGSSSLGLSLYETFRYNKKLYKVTKGPNKGKQVDIYKRTKKGEIQLKNNKPQFRSKQAKWHYTKGRLLKAGGTILNILNLGIVMYDISENNYRPTFKQKLDLAVAIFAFVPNFGWIVSGIYFILDAFGVIDWLIEMFREESNYEFDYIEVPKTRVVEEVYFEEFSDTKLLGDWRDREININIPMLKNNEQERIKK